MSDREPAPEMPPYFVIVYKMHNDRYCIHLAKDGDKPRKYETVPREDVAQSVIAAIEAAEEDDATPIAE